MAEVVERVSIHPPAVGGKELRWRDGRWEKLLAKGWVPAGEGKSKEASQAAEPRNTKRQLEADIDEALAGSGGSPRLSHRTKWNLYDKAGRLVGDVSAYSSEEALRLAGGPGVASARLPRQGSR